MLVAHGKLVPIPLTREYRVRIEYCEGAGNRPEIYVEEPKLSRRPQEPDTPIPHTYDSNTPGKERPCAFHPSEWDGTRSIANTVIPWLMSWLLDYEIWHATGRWHGGGEHPTVKSSATKKWLKKRAAGT